MDRKTTAIFVACGIGLVAAWGPLDPPEGPITSTHKTLTEVEPRIAVNAANTPGDAGALFKITKPGSYYLTGNISGAPGKRGIEITVEGVTLDLGGFTLEGADGLSRGIYSEWNSTVIRNGRVTGWSTGVLVQWHSRVEDIESSDNADDGILALSGTLVLRCNAIDNGGSGIRTLGAAVIIDCTSWGAGSNGIVVGPGGRVVNCIATSNGKNGLELGSGASAQGCTATSNEGSGFRASATSTLTDCTAKSNAGAAGFEAISRVRLTRCIASDNEEGFLLTEANSVVECTSGDNLMAGFRIAGNGNTVERCTSNENAGSGFYVSAGIGNNIDGNLATYNGTRGFWVFSSDNLVVRNRARGNPTANYVISDGSDYGVILTNPGQGFTSSAAWANFAY